MSWISDSIIYQINWRSIAAREPRNPLEAMNGDQVISSPFVYVRENLSVLHEMGVNLLYFMPIFPIGIEGRKGIGSPYAIRDYYGIADEYGTLAELIDLINAAHFCNMKVILDITPNHTSSDNVWTKDHPEYYVKNEQGGLFYDFDWSDTAKMDYHCPALRKEMHDVMVSWLAVCGSDGFDGFRLDMAHMINDLSFWNEIVLLLKSRYPEKELLFLAESYGFDTNVDLFTRGINSVYDDNFYKICQYGYALDQNGSSVVSLSPAGEYNDDFKKLYSAFSSSGIAGAVESILSDYDEILKSIDGDAWLARYTDNHDEGRGLHRFGEGAVKAMMQLVFMAPHTLPFILCGQEFGAMNRPSIHERIGVCDKGPRLLNSEELPGIELQGNMFASTAEKRLEWFNFYKALISLRKTVPELVAGSFAVIDIGEQCAEHERSIIAFERKLEGNIVRCAVNLGQCDRKLDDTTKLQGECLYGEFDGTVLKAFEAVVVKVKIENM